MAKIYSYIGTSLVAASAGAFIGTQMGQTLAGGVYWLLVIIEFAFLLSLFFMKKAQTEGPLAIFLLFGFTFVSGLTLGPTLSILLSTPAGASILINTLLTTGVAVGGLSFFAINTKKDFSVFSQIMFVALIALIVVSVINIFIGSSLLQMIIAWVGVILFSFYLIWDTQKIVKGEYHSPIIMAASVYIDILNIFLSILQLFISFEDD